MCGHASFLHSVPVRAAARGSVLRLRAVCLFVVIAAMTMNSAQFRRHKQRRGRLAAVALLVGTAAAMYPVVFRPMLVSDYDGMQKRMLESQGLKKEDIQPPGICCEVRSLFLVSLYFFLLFLSLFSYPFFFPSFYSKFFCPCPFGPQHDWRPECVTGHIVLY